MDFTRYETLSENAQQFLCYHFTHTLAAGKRMPEIWYTLKRHCFPRFDGMAALKELKDAAIMSDAGHDWYSNTMMYKASPVDVVPVILYAYSRRQDLMTMFKKANLEPDIKHQELHNALSLYAESRFTDTSLAPELYPDYAQFLASVAHEKEMTPFISHLSYNALSRLCSFTFDYWIENDMVMMASPLALAVKGNASLTELQRYHLLALIDLYTYISLGITPYEGVLQSAPAGQLQMAIMLAKAGKYEAAAELFGKQLSAADQTIVSEGQFNSSIVNLYYVLSLMHIGTFDSRVTLKSYTARLNADDDTSLASLILAEDFMKMNKDKQSARLTGMSARALGHETTKLQMSYAYMITAYFGMPLHKMDSELCRPAIAILRHEMLPWLQGKSEEDTQLRLTFGSNMVLATIPRKAEWQNVLDQLTAELSGTVSADKTHDDVRIMYIRHSTATQEIEVREQHRLKSGEWGSGKAISEQRYLYSDLPYMNEADIRIRNRARGSRYYRVMLADCIEELIGSDRLYYGSRAPFEPVKVEHDTPYLIVEKENSRFVVKSNVTLNALKHEPVIVENSTTSYSVLNLSPQEKSWYEKLLTVGSFPLDAEDSLRSFLPTIGGKIEVHSSLIEGGSTLPVVEGNSMIGFKLSPHNGGNHEVGIFVRPLLGGSHTYPAGTGDTTIIDESEATGRVRVNRSLAAENAALNTLLELWQGLGYDELPHDDDFPPELVLDLIQLIQSNPELCYAEWPEGQTLRLRTVKRGASSWSGVVHDRGTWFEIEGDIAIDDDTVLSISQLLELVSKSHGRYVRMSDGEYLALSEKLQRQLRSLEAIANRERGKLKISPFSAALMNADMVTGEINLALDNKIKETQQRILDSSDYTPAVPAELNATLRPYQIDGYQWIARLNSWGAGALLADDMGLGKTIQTIAYLLLKKEEGPSLVVAPASVAPNWKNEMEKFAPTLNCEILNYAANRKKVIDMAKAGDVIITTYGILLSIQSFITSKKWNVVCLDEAHIIKNRGAKTSAAAMKIQADNRVMLTGTPVQNHLGELWSLFQFVNPGMLGGYENFHQKFIIPIEADHNKERQEQLDRIVRPFMLRRTKQSVLKELPDKTEIYQPVELSKEELAVYEGLRKRAEQMLADHMKKNEGGNEIDVNVLAEITRLRQAACSSQLVEPKWSGDCAKITSLVELLQGIIEGDNRTLVFSQFVSFLDIVRRALDQAGIPYLYIDGSVPLKRRSELVDAFQNGECPVFLISLKAGGLGLNLTGANYVIHLDPWWNPAIEQQATDRAHRIGQKQAVTVYHLVSKNTIEEKIIRLHKTKRDLADNLLEGTDMSHKLTGKDLLEMLKR